MKITKREKESFYFLFVSSFLSRGKNASERKKAMGKQIRNGKDITERIERTRHFNAF